MEINSEFSKQLVQNVACFLQQISFKNAQQDQFDLFQKYLCAQNSQNRTIDKWSKTLIHSKTHQKSMKINSEFSSNLLKTVACFLQKSASKMRRGSI